MNNPYGVEFVSREKYLDIIKSEKEVPENIAIHKEYVTESIKAEGKESRKIKFTISTESVDRDRDIIKADGWKLKNYKKNPVVLWGHSYREMPVAKSPSIKIEDRKLVSVAEFPSAEIYDFSETVFQMIHFGALNAASVGFRPMKHTLNEERMGIDILQAELLEWSIVPVPANQDAIVQLRLSDEHKETLKNYSEWCERFLDDFYGGKGVWVPKEQVQAVFNAMNEANNARKSFVVRPDSSKNNSYIPKGGVVKVKESIVDDDFLMIADDDDSSAKFFLVDDDAKEDEGTVDIDPGVLRQEIAETFTHGLAALISKSIRAEIKYISGTIE